MGKTNAERQRAFRARQSGHVETELAKLQSEVVWLRSLVEKLVAAIGVTDRNGGVTAAAPGGRESLSSSSQSLEITKETESESTRARAVTKSVTESNGGSNGLSKDPERYVALDDQLDHELEAIAQLANVQDIKAAWLKFTGYYAGRHIHVSGRWQKWCVREALEERDRRERERKNGKVGPAEASSTRIKPLSEAALRRMAPGLFDDGMGNKEAKVK